MDYKLWQVFFYLENMSDIVNHQETEKSKKHINYGVAALVMLSSVFLLVGCGEETDSNTNGENETNKSAQVNEVKGIDPSAYVEDETIKFAQVGNWKLDGSNSMNFYRLENPSIMIDGEKATITIIPFKRIFAGATAQDAIDQEMKRSSDVKQENNITINGIEYAVATENSVFGTTYIFLFNKHKECLEDEIAEISIVNATIEDAMPVLKTITFKELPLS